MINEVTLIGIVGKDAELKDVNGSKVASFSVATEENYRDGDEWKGVTTWHRVAAWKNVADQAVTAAKRGNLVYVGGKIAYKTFTDKDGTQKSIAEIVANRVRTLRRSESGGSSYQRPSYPKNNVTSSSAVPPRSEGSGQKKPLSDGDLPF